MGGLVTLLQRWTGPDKGLDLGSAVDAHRGWRCGDRRTRRELLLAPRERLKVPVPKVQQVKAYTRVIVSNVRRQLGPDLLAALTVALVGIPQAMSYAAIAGVNPVYGLYTAVIPAVVGSLFGSSHHLITGPTNATALGTAAVLLARAGQPDYVEYVFAMALLTGAVRLTLGLLRLGGITRYVSNSVLTGFLSGAGVLIIINQLHSLLGLSRPAGENTLGVLSDVWQHLPDVNLHVLAISVLAMGLMFLGVKMGLKFVRALVAIVVASVVVQVLGWDSLGVPLVGGMGTLEQARLGLHVPSVSVQDVASMLPSAGALALLSLVESMSIAKTISLASRQRIDASRELVGQGLASLVGGFFRCIPSSGSLSRSAVAYSSGARTRLVGVLSGLFVLVAAVGLSGLIGYIPVAGLAGVVVASSYRLFDFQHLKLTWQSREASRLILMVTFVSTLLMPLHLAIYLGTLLSIVIYLFESGRVELRYLEVTDSGSFVERDLKEMGAEMSPIAVVEIVGTLHFAAVDEMESALMEVLEAGVKVMILRVRHLRLLGSTGVAALKRIADRASQRGACVLMVGVTDEIGETLESSGVTTGEGVITVFEAHDALFEATHQALDRARELVAKAEE